METIPLFTSNKQKTLFLFVALVLFSINLIFEYIKYKNFIDEEVYKTHATIVNIYKKNNYNIIKLQTKNFTCFTSTNESHKKLKNINIYLVTNNINFFQYLKGFYTKSFNITPIQEKSTIKNIIYDKINQQHTNEQISSLYSALFLAISVNSDMRDIFASFGISHLIAISGFHLGVISLVLYFIFNILYTPIHQRYIPYRNKRFDILIVISFVLFEYLLLIDIAPSFLRSFIMFIFGIFLLRSNIKIISFETLFLITVIIIALFPKLLFSLSLWFSVAGVFYIFLFIKYFQKTNKYLQIILFNFWIYLAINPITHYFFGITTVEQIFSPILTILFTIFYPISALFHILGFGDIFDSFLVWIFNLNIDSIVIFTPLWFFVVYTAVSLTAVFFKKGFYILNILFILFNLWLYL